MKLDEDIVYEQVENLRNEMVKYINSVMTQEERNSHGQNLMDICHNGLIHQMKLEQMERNNSEIDEFNFLNQERMKHFDY